MDWIEKTLGISPAGGNGLTELVLLAALLFLVIGLVLRRRATRERRRG